MTWTRNLILLTICLSAAVVHAQIVADSSTFDFKYEMDVQPSSLDLDGNGTNDWFDGVAGGQTEPLVSGGVATSNQAADPAENLFRTDYGGSLTRAALVQPGDDFNYRIEVSIAIDAITMEPDAVGVAGIALQLPDDGTGLRMNIAPNEVNFNFDGIDPIPTGDNTNGFHTFQILRDAPNSYWIWRDDVLLNPGGPIQGTNFFNGNGGLFRW